MTSMRTDDDLERLLRATLDSRACTVTTGPHWTGATGRRAPRRWIAPLVAAALVLVLAGAFVIFRVHRTTTAPAHPGRDFTSFDVPGYPITSRLTYGNERSVIVRTPHGVRYGDVDVSLYAAGKYQFSRLQHQRRVLISGHAGYTGWAGFEDHQGKTRPLHAVVWRYAPQRWAVVQQLGNLNRVPPAADLLAIARATRPDEQLGQTTPFRITTVPAGYRFDHVEVQPSARVLILVLEGRGNQMLTLTASPVGSGATTPGDLIRQHGDTVLDINAWSSRGQSATAATRSAARYVAAHLVWGTADLGVLLP
jgi:hypothetical protein